MSSGYYHFHANIGSRSDGKSAVAAAAYRAGDDLEVTSETAMKFGETFAEENDKEFRTRHYYKKKKGVIHTEIIAPEGSPDWVFDRQTLWNKAEDAESHTRFKTAQLWRDIQVGLPHYFDAEMQKKVVQDFVQNVFVSQGMIADIAIHEPTARNDSRNFHAHIMLTFREVDGDGFSKKKNREWNDKDNVDIWRKEWEEHLNKAIEAYGYDQRVDSRSYEDIAAETGEEPLIPTKYKGSKNYAMEKDGLETGVTEYNQGVREHNIENSFERVAARQSKFDLADITKELKRAGLASYMQDSYWREFKRQAHHSQLPLMVDAFAQNYWKQKVVDGVFTQTRTKCGRFSSQFRKTDMPEPDTENIIKSFDKAANSNEKEDKRPKKWFNIASKGWFRLKPRVFSSLFWKYCKKRYKNTVRDQRKSSFLSEYGFSFARKRNQNSDYKMGGS